MVARQRGSQRHFECAGAGDPNPLAQSWLDIQCKMIAGVSRAVVISSQACRNVFSRSAHWPRPGTPSPDLEHAANDAIHAKQCIMIAKQSPHDAVASPSILVACPLLFSNELAGAVAVEISDRSIEQQDAVKKLLQWGALWLQFSMQQQSPIQPEPALTLFSAIATCLEHGRFQAAATALVTEMTGLLCCSRVSLGLLKGKHIRVSALSHSARIDAKSKLLRAISAAMDETVDQNATIAYPFCDESGIQITRAHEEFAKKHECRAVCTTPLHHDQRSIGALTLERSNGDSFDSATIQAFEQIAAFVGPILELKLMNERPLIGKIWDSCLGLIEKFIGPKHSMFKLTATTACGLLALVMLVHGDYRVTANAILEGRVQRVVVAPQQGFIATAEVRAGDFVKTGDTLGKLDEKDLKLERLKWSNQNQQLLKEFREALAKHDRTQISILSAKTKQAEAQIELIDEQLARTQLIAPFDGVVIEGDLSQSLGSPVERGDVLFKIAPLDQYRLILNVDEQDIADIKTGQSGRLILPSLSGEPLDLTVETITPISETEDGRNYFRVEASLNNQPETLRPGMQGIGKISIDRRKLAWIWTHDITDWIRLWTWSILP